MPMMSFAFLDGSINSCRALFNDLGTFAKYSGLKPNISKTQAFWAGSQHKEYEKLYSHFSFKWTKKLKVLGAVFSNVDEEVYEENFESNLRYIKSIISSWKKEIYYA